MAGFFHSRSGATIFLFKLKQYTSLDRFDRLAFLIDNEPANGRRGGESMKRHLIIAAVAAAPLALALGAAPASAETFVRMLSGPAGGS